MLLVVVFCVLMTISQGNGQCNRCTPYNVMCVSSTSYQYCMFLTGTPIGEPVTCEAGKICSANTTETPSVPCVDTKPFLQPDCTCGWCIEDYNYACVSNTQLQLCLDGISPSEPVITCPAGTNCDYTYSSGSYCAADAVSSCSAATLTTTPAPNPSSESSSSSDSSSPSSSSSSESSSPSSSSPDVSSSSSSSPDESSSSSSSTEPAITPTTPFTCSSVGKFPLPGTRCQSYVTCVQLNNGNWGTYTYMCINGNLFNPSTNRCSNSYVCPET